MIGIEILLTKSNKRATTTREEARTSMQKANFIYQPVDIDKERSNRGLTPTSRSSNFIFIIKLPDKRIFKKKSSFCYRLEDADTCYGSIL